MRSIISMLIAVFVSGSLAGCVVRSHPHHHGRGHSHSHVRSRDCPPAHHWEKGRCVHNGRGKAKGHHRRK